MELIPPSSDRNTSEPKLLLPEAKRDLQTPTTPFILKNLDKILFATSSIYLIVVIFWLVNKSTIKLPWLAQNAAETKSKPEPKKSQYDAEFIKYMRESIAAIERKKAELKPKIATKPTETKIIERIYIPVSATAEKILPQKNNSENRLSVPAPPPIKGKPRLFPTQTPARKTTQLKPEPVKESQVSHVLVGLLESGTNSVALFSIEGDTRRFKIGQKIGQSGWTLIGAANRVAKISRNGKIRYISAGEKI